MSTLEILLLVVVLVLIAAGAWYVLRMRRRQHFSGRFGPEYERTLQDKGDRKEAERELERREERVAQLDIRPLESDQRARYAAEWQTVQARFVDKPVEAVSDADRLIEDVMQRRGYPVGDFERRSADLSVDYADVVQNYRSGHELAERSRTGEADTEDLRRAMVHYRALFDELLEDSPHTHRTETRR